MNTTTKCSHDRTESGARYGFSRSVAVDPYTQENRRAHGGTTYTETCLDCGAARKVNANAGSYECSPWGPAAQANVRRYAEVLWADAAASGMKDEQP